MWLGQGCAWANRLASGSDGWNSHRGVQLHFQLFTSKGGHRFPSCSLPLSRGLAKRKLCISRPLFFSSLQHQALDGSSSSQGGNTPGRWVSTRTKGLFLPHMASMSQQGSQREEVGPSSGDLLAEQALLWSARRQWPQLKYLP